MIVPTVARLAGTERREALVAAALDTFAGRPFDDVRMEEIADAAQVSKALLYKHFPGKRDLYLEVVRTVTTNMLTTIAVSLITRDRDGEEPLSVALHAFTDFAETNQALFTSLFHSGLLGDPEFGAEIERIRIALEDLLGAAGERTPQWQVGLRGVMGFVEAATVRWLQLPPGTMTGSEVAFLIETTLRLGLDRVNPTSS